MSALLFTQATRALLATATLSLSTIAAAQTVNPTPSTPQPQQIQRGEYLARAGDCMACHTVKGKAPFSGGLAMNTPFGTIYSTNITPDKQTGIGDYSYDDFASALRKGKGRNGVRLYPAMPYTSFAKLSDEDVSALYAYFMQGVKPVQQDNPKTALPFPFNMRILMAGWNMLFFESKPFKADSTQSISWNRGAYLVQSLGHCGACHTPHGRFGQEKSLDGSDDGFLSGYTLDNWHAPSLRNDKDGLGRWNKEQIASYLRTGRTADGAAFGAMSQVINDSTQHLSDADLLAIGEYLSSLSGKKPADGAAKAPVATAASNAAGADQPATLELRSGKLQTAGALVYLNNCNACHRSDGTGAMKAFPALGKNAVVNVADPTSLIHVVLAGSAMPSTKSDPSPMGMPGFGWRLSDQEVAEVVSFIRGNWGNHAAAVSAEQVAAVRKGVEK
ncbi:c-type cytochrome [Herbaspirillum sp. NPDC101396]|uniref:c-type cytochrome n=1 Tax=Herbaspirillum sp. NPDC101396 TaxID=3364005 RepID=UPI003839E36B